MYWKSDMCRGCGTCEFSIARECEFYRPSGDDWCENYEPHSTYEYWEDEREDEYDEDYEECEAY